MSDQLAPDLAFPRLHGRPARGWLNDPNGCAYIDGRYHVFFQYNPDAPVHDAIKWGHVSSADLVDWRLEPIALVNRHAELDQYGCWTGCVVDDDGVPTAVYSAVIDGSGRAEVVLARSDRDLVVWRPERTSVVGMPDDLAISDVRDPYVFSVGGHRYAVQGAGHRQGRPRILVYGCDDLTVWTELGTFLSADDPIAFDIAPANIWECPNLLRFGERWVLIVSLWRQVDGVDSLAGVRYLVGDLVVGQEGPRFTCTGGGMLDDGPCFYAPQAVSADGRVLLWGWAWEHGRTPEQVAEAGWAGALTFCRELSLVDGVLVSRPAAELEALRRGWIAVRPGEPFDAVACEVVLGGDAGRVSLALVDDGEERIVAEWETPSTGHQPARVLVDGSMVEIFAGGPTAYTTRAYPTAGSSWLLRTSSPCTLDAWHLGLTGRASVAS